MALHSEVPAQDILSTVASASGKSVSKVGLAQGVSNREGALGGGSSPHAAIDLAQVSGFARGGLHQGQERDTPSE